MVSHLCKVIIVSSQEQRKQKSDRDEILKETIAHRPQFQERMTSNIADIVMEKLNPLGTIVVVEAEHMCMTMRGVKRPGVQTVTTAARGIYENQVSLRSEVMGILKHK